MATNWYTEVKNLQRCGRGASLEQSPATPPTHVTRERS